MTGLAPTAGRNPALRRPCLVSFSGIDGAGKTTQIDAVLEWLQHAGHQVRVLRFWDDIAMLGHLRETASHKLFGSERGVGSAGRPVERRDKNIRAWYMSFTRLFLYSMDAIRLAFVVAASLKSEVDVIVFDRYLYDELANLNLGSRAARAYVRMLLRVVPRPDSAFVLDADPVQARARKPEYPVDFLRSNRASYLDLASMTEGLTVVAPSSPEDVTRTILRQVVCVLPRPRANVTSKLG